MRQKYLRLSPPHLVILSFAGVIAGGAVLLALPLSAKAQKLAWEDALFLATSAVCVTGLSPVDPGRVLSFFGQVILLTLIQVGGLGYMTISAFAAILIRRRLSVTHRLSIEIMFGELVEAWNLLRHTLLFTFMAEALGALLLFLAFGQYGLSFGERLWFSLFHSVSAFCNAGLDVFGLVGSERRWASSLQPFAHDPFIVLTINFLFILGGLGFPVIVEIVDKIKGKRMRWSVHTRTVFIVNLALWFGGAVLIWLFEFNNPETLEKQTLPVQLMSAFFQSATARTAGFSTVPTGSLTAASLWLLCLWMFIGASPGGTGGGIKTTTVAVLAAATLSGVRMDEQVVLFRRAIPPERLSKAVTFALLATNTVGIAALLLCVTEKNLLVSVPYGPLSLLFEATSAFGTVGLSTGVTPLLSVYGKLILVATMFIGRVGLLTLLITIIGRKSEPVRYPHEEILVG
ncbi:MAG: TrkH family potassium uptake protein [Candidatus Fervidibacter sp.]|uniref:TrkH family potassium uptake protein n=1 Tax=Candidatus Fervidibacter sp. TaxID=3100871 RepID=UPI00404B0883